MDTKEIIAVYNKFLKQKNLDKTFITTLDGEEQALLDILGVVYNKGYRIGKEVGFRDDIVYKDFDEEE